MLKKYMTMIAVVLSFCICGCAAGNDGTVSSDALAEADSGDSYTCVVNTQLEAERGEEEAGNGRSSSFLGNGRAFRFIDYFLGQRENNYTEIVVADSNGLSNSLKWPFGEDGYTVGAGSAAGSDGFVTLFNQFPESEGGEYQYIIEKRGVDGKVKETVPLNFLSSPEYKETAFSIVMETESIAVDIDGYIHMAGTPCQDDRMDYRVVSPEGELFWVKQFDQYSFVRLIALPDGRIACDSQEYKDIRQYHHKVEWIDTQTGKEKLLFEYDDNDEYRKHQIQAVNLFDDEKLIYADAGGVFLCDYSFQNSEKIYTWSRHGIIQPWIENISVSEDGAISVLMRNTKGLFFVLLGPAPEEVFEIELAVSSGSTIYYDAVLEFNKRHPEYNIVIRDDYDKTALLTRLMAGDGPVLIGSDLVPFEEQKKLWEPLDKVYEELGILDKLNSAAIKLASIDGSLYGIVPDFSIRTLVTGAEETDWDYDAFIKCIENSGELKYIMDNALGESDAWIAVSIFDHGREDSFYINAENGELKFDTEEFRNVLKLIDLYGCDKVSVPFVEGIKEGEVLCNNISISHPKDLIFYRHTYGDDVNIVGFPGESGAKNLLRSPHILAIRQTASDRDKEIAVEFVKMLLSYDMQLKMSKDDNFLLSVRTDVLEEQINSVSKGTWLTSVCFDDYGFYLGEPDNEKNGKELMELIEKAVPDYEHSNDYRDILYEELEDYFSGEITEDMLIDHLNNRVGLYLKETQ